MSVTETPTEVEKYKVILIGDAGVGKTSLARRQVDSSFDFKMNPTVGTSHMKSKLTIENHNVELMIWDTAGHEQFASLVPLYSRNADVCVVVASVVNLDSYNNIQVWIERLHEAGEYPPIIVALNKIDLLEDPPLTIDEIRAKYANGIENIIYTSARTGDGVAQLFGQVAADAILFQRNMKRSETVNQILQTPEPKKKTSCC
ncbi:small GTP-binding protein [Tritrichomonas foetus]|uniref:Small GTP-binding protein n=1 Tax=Tritrichomonas foetus TaxID=1144522 RepID=A0A1J4KBU4_9EUKA|nr:small GTP-binding protein [Tritrichomonas foetus]|eukprot:OHT08881.1 small GTP-binding protein [Tritrichomonas foetus]